VALIAVESQAEEIGTLRTMRHGLSDERTERSPRGESTRERVLQSAARVLSERGYAAATLNEIARGADTKAGSLYYYFDSRESLIREVMTRGINETLAHVQAALDGLPPGASSKERLSAVIKAHVEHVLSGSDIARASIRILGQAPDDVQGPAIALHRSYGRTLASLISAAAHDGYLSSDIDERLLRLLLVGAANWATMWFDPAGPSTAADVGETLAAIVFASSSVDATPPSLLFGSLHARAARSGSDGSR
jgi:AcrR family transcriptional regulator